jgi:hypothetical protein
MFIRLTILNGNEKCGGKPVESFSSDVREANLDIKPVKENPSRNKSN